MLELIPAPTNVLAVVISGKVTGDDIDTVIDRLDDAMNAYDKFHVFVETRLLDGIEVSGLPRYWMRAVPLLGKLARFGRVAVVADQAWVRAGTRIESFILPSISYRTYLPENRDEALNWVVDGRDT